MQAQYTGKARFFSSLTLTSLLLMLVLPLQAERLQHQSLDRPLTPPGQELPLDELRSFAEVFERIKQTYVHDVDDRTLINNAIQGMLSGLDPHSDYLEPEAFQELRESTQGEFGGLGIEIGIEDGYIQVISPIDETPASRAGIQPLDLIVRIDGRSTRELTLDQAIELMRGEPGTSVTLTISRPASGQPFEVELTRDLIRTRSVRQELLEEDYGYLRISQFQNRTGQEVKAAIEQLAEDNSGDLKGLILDLRNNPGGVLQAAVDVSDLFLNEGLIVYTEGRLADTAMRFEANPGDALNGTPLVVLINSGSASASEILAGALQDHRRALVMGTASFGKGSVQSVLPLQNNRALKMTTALYYTPKGRSIQADGIHPDIQVINARITPVEEPKRTREADLQGHLQGQQKTTQTTQSTPASLDDYAVNEALNLLKGLAIYSERQLNQ